MIDVWSNSSGEKPLVKPTAPGSLSRIFAFAIYFFLAFIIKSIKPKIPCCNFSLFILFSVRSINLLQIYLTSVCHLRHRTRKGWTTPLTCRVARICYLCVGAVYVVLLGSPTGSITLVSHLREIPTIVVLHHPFLFREIPT